MIEWRERVANVLAVAVVLLAGGSLAIGIRNALFDATPLRAGSFSSDDVADLGATVQPGPEPVVDAPTTSSAPSATSSTTSTSTTVVRGSVPITTATTRAVAVTAGSGATTTTSSTTSTTVEDDDGGNRGRGSENRGRGKPEDD